MSRVPLKSAAGPVVVLWPSRGVSALDAQGQPFFDPEADAALFDALRTHLAREVRLTIIDAYLNDDAFASAAVSELLNLLPPSNPADQHA